MTHCLKTWPEYFKKVINGEKQFEARKEDRPYNVGDTLILQEYSPSEQMYTGQEEAFMVTYILRGIGEFGIQEGFCVMSIKPKE